MSRRRFVAGDRVRVAWGGIGDDRSGSWQVWRDETDCGYVTLRRTDRIAGSLSISAACVRLVRTVEEELARELMS